MATEGGEDGKPDPKLTFKGSAQPPANERLEAIKIFLADEDPDRHFEFETRLAEIEEYIAHIKKHKVHCRASLLRDVEIMVQAQKDWKKGRERRLPSDCVHVNSDRGGGLRNSTRLVDLETSTALEKARKSFDVHNQMRADHPPFTVTRENDEVEFSRAMLEDAAADPLAINKRKNLLWVENRAYNWALEDPAMIPYWMHSTHGIQTAGRKPIETGPTPWYRLEDSTDGGNIRPFRRALPDYLQEREDEINRLLRKNKLSDDQSSKLDKLLRLHEPDDVAERYKLWQERLGHVFKDNNEVDKLKDKYYAARDAWLETFRSDGIYLMELRKGPQSDQPGVFYLPGPEAISTSKQYRARHEQETLNDLIQILRTGGGYHSLNEQDKDEIDMLLNRFAPDRFKTERHAAKFLNLDKEDPLAIAWVQWVESIVKTSPKLVLLRPGEMEREDPSILSIAWEAGGPEVLVPDSRREDAIAEVHALAEKKMDLRFGRKLSAYEQARLIDLVVSEYQPYLADFLKWAAESIPTEDSDTPEESEDVATSTAALQEVWVELTDLIEAWRKRSFGITVEKSQAEQVAEELKDSTEINEGFANEFVKWFTRTKHEREIVAGLEDSGHFDFISRAERRGIQRAAIELGLNLLATNQEQHRPDDSFRIVRLPPVYQPPEKEVSLALPLEPWKRPVERDPFEFSKKVAAYQKMKDSDYQFERDEIADRRPGRLTAPINYNGPFVPANALDYHEAAGARLELLTEYYSALADAQEASPRPLLQQILRRITWFQNPDSAADPEPQGRRRPLSEDDFDLLEELTEPPWDEYAKEYSKNLFWGNTSTLNRLLEFERDLVGVMEEIPLWQPQTELTSATSAAPPDLARLFAPIQYGRSLRSGNSISLRQILQKISNKKLEIKVPSSRLWTYEEASRFLTVMADFNRIHRDNGPNNTDVCISRIPLTGHPENRYIASIEGALSSPGVYLNPEGNLEVQYGATGVCGPPILQPNMYSHFFDLARRFGQEMLACMQTRARPLRDWPADQGIKEQLAAWGKTVKQMEETPTEHRCDMARGFDLRTLASELNAYAPDLAQEAGFDWSEEIAIPNNETGTKEEVQIWRQRQSEYAALLQMQILEEVNNNWEPRFPENEHVWDFAADRVAPLNRTIDGREVKVAPRRKRFFSMRTFPLKCQKTATQNRITNSGPEVPEKPAPPTKPATKTREEIEQEALIPKKKVARHIKGRMPYFPFGETPYQQAWLSYRMEHDLKDVPEFQSKPQPTEPTPRFLWGRRKQPSPAEPFALPKIPTGWTPDNVSKTEKRAALLKYAKETPGFPDPNILEYYHNQEEIQEIREFEWEEKNQKAVQEANVAVEALLKKNLSGATASEVRAARIQLGIHPLTGQFTLKAANRGGLFGRESNNGQAINGKSQTSGKRGALEQADGQKSSKMRRHTK